MALSLEDISQLFKPADASNLQLTMPQLMGVDPSQQEPSFGIQPLPQPASIPDRLTDDASKDDMATYVKSLAEKAGVAGAGAKAAGSPGMVKAGETVRTQEGGLTPLQQGQSVAAQGKAALGEAGVDADRLATDSMLQAEHAAKLRATVDVENEQREKMEHENETRQQRLRDQQEFLLEQKDEPPSADRYYEKMGVFSKLAAIASAFSYGYFNPRGGTAPVVEAVQKMAAEDVREQMAAAAQNKSRRQDLVNLYERKYGDTTLVAKKLEADKLRTLAKTMAADEAESKSADAKGRSEDLRSKVEIRADLLDQQVTDALVAKPVAERTTTYRAAAGKGAVDPVERAKKTAEAAKALEAAGVGKDAIAKLFRDQGMEAPTGQTAHERDVAAAAAKANELTSDEKKDIREKIDGLAKMANGFDEIDKIGTIKRDARGEVTSHNELITGSAGGRQFLEATAGSLPFGIGEGVKEANELGDPEELKALRRSVEKVTDGMMRAASGAGGSEKEAANYRKRLPMTSAESFKRASAEIWREQFVTYKRLKAQLSRKGVDVDAELRASGIDPSRFHGGD